MIDGSEKRSAPHIIEVALHGVDINSYYGFGVEDGENLDWAAYETGATHVDADSWYRDEHGLHVAVTENEVEWFIPMSSIKSLYIVSKPKV